MLVRVRGGTWKQWATGFVVGARGEIVFNTPQAPTNRLEVMTLTGERLEGALLGFDRNLAVGVARVEGLNVPPIGVAKKGFRKGDWVVAMTFDTKTGRTEPFAGVVEGPIHRSKRKPKNALVARVDVPGQPGGPVLSADRGELVGVAFDRGRRRTRVVLIETLVPFLKTVVLNADPRNN